MKTTLTLLKTFNLTINGVVFENMKQTGELDGIAELSNGTTKATLLRTGSNFGGFFDSLFSDGVLSDWVPLRGTPDIQKAAALLQERAVAKEPTVLRSDFDLCMQDKNRCVKLIEDVHALLCAGKDTHAKELLEKRVNNQTVNIPPFIEQTPPQRPVCTHAWSDDDSNGRQHCRLCGARSQGSCQ